MVDALPALTYLAKRILLELVWGWTHLPFGFLVHTMLVAGVTLMASWRFLTRQAREKEEEMKDKLFRAEVERKQKLRQAEISARKIVEQAKKEAEDVKAEAERIHQEKVGKWREYIQQLESKISALDERIENMKDLARQALNNSEEFQEERIKNILRKIVSA